MRYLVRKWSVCLIAAATAACSAPAGNDSAGAGNSAANVEAEAEAGNEAAPAPDNEAAPPAEGNAAAAADYRASGTEPFWSLSVTDVQMVYDSADGPDVRVATPPRQPTRAGYRYVTAEMTVAVNTVQRCDAASGDEYHDTVRVTIGAATVAGCGGEVTAAAE